MTDGTGDSARECMARFRAPLGRAWDAGRLRHESVHLPRERFQRRALKLTLRRLGRTFPRPADEQVDDALRLLAGEDLYLALACETAAPGAWEALMEEYAPRLRGLLHRLWARGDRVDELVGDLFGFLYLPPVRGGARTRLGSYDGTGTLFSWLAVIVRRRFIDEIRKEGQELPPPRPSRAVQPGEGERLECLEAALEGALSGLDPLEVLAFHLRHHAEIDQRSIARQIGRDPAWVSRHLKKIRGRWQDEIAERGCLEAGADTGELT